MRLKRSVGARWVGAVLFAVAGAATAYGVLAVDDAATLEKLRQTAPLAGALGLFLGWAVAQEWPRRPSAGIMTGIVTALVGLTFFSGLYLFAEAVIEAARQGEAAKAVTDASSRLWARLPLAIPMAAAAFGLAGAMHWLIGFATRPRKAK